MILVDTHSHIYLPEFDKDRADVMYNADKQNVKHILLPNIDSTSIESMLALSSKYPDRIYSMMG